MMRGSWWTIRLDRFSLCFTFLLLLLLHFLFYCKAFLLFAGLERSLLQCPHSSLSSGCFLFFTVACTSSMFKLVFMFVIRLCLILTKSILQKSYVARATLDNLANLRLG